jgi:hypothetical protein
LRRAADAEGGDELELDAAVEGATSRLPVRRIQIGHAGGKTSGPPLGGRRPHSRGRSARLEIIASSAIALGGGLSKAPRAMTSTGCRLMTLWTAPPPARKCQPASIPTRGSTMPSSPFGAKHGSMGPRMSRIGPRFLPSYPPRVGLALPRFEPRPAPRLTGRRPDDDCSVKVVALPRYQAETRRNPPFLRVFSVHKRWRVCGFHSAFAGFRPARQEHVAHRAFPPPSL